MKKTAQTTHSPSDRTAVASLCPTDLGPLQVARSLLETMGRFGSTLPLLSTTYVDHKKSEVVILDQEVGSPGWTLETRIPCEVMSAEPWSVKTVPLMQEMTLNPLPPNPPKIDFALRAGKPVLDCGAEDSWNIEGVPEKVSNRTPASPAEIVVPSALLLHLIESVIPSVCADLTRSHLAQVLIDVAADKIISVSTDGHRLTKTEVRASLPAGLGGQLMIPSGVFKPLLSLLRTRPEALVARCSGASWSVRVGQHRIVISPADAQFPPYDQVIPADHRPGARVLVETRPLIAALKHFETAFKAQKDLKIAGIALTPTDDKLRIWSDTLSKQDRYVDRNDAGSAAKNSRKELLTVGMGLNYLSSAVRQIGGDQIWLEFGEELDPIVLRPGSYIPGQAASGSSTLIVVMPMRL